MIPFKAINVLIACTVILMIRSELHIPDVQFQILKNGGFRAYMRDPENETVSGIVINIVKAPFALDRPEIIYCGIKLRVNGNFAFESKKKVNRGDLLYYSVELGWFPNMRSGGMILFWRVQELVDSYRILPYVPVAQCEEILLYDQFLTDRINTDNWIIEHKIPTYTGPRFVFNSYLNTPETVFVKDNLLHLQPIALTNEDDVRGSLNLSSSCTSCILEECVYTQLSTFLLPPVKSAMLRSRHKFRYGRFQIEARLPEGDWIFPIIELARPTTDHVSVDELWIVFSRGNRVYFRNDINEYFKMEILYAGPVNNADEPLRSKKLVSYNTIESYNGGFHLFELKWYPDKLQFFVDNNLIGEINSQLGLFGSSGGNLEYELQIGVAIGGLVDFPDSYRNKPWNNNERNYMKKFFEDRINWLQTWNRNRTALIVNKVKVSALEDNL